MNTATDSIYKGTPTIVVKDNRGLSIRALSYNRTSLDDDIDERITRNIYTALGFPKSSIDPRLLTLSQTNTGVKPNISVITSLNGVELRKESIDSGRIVILPDVEGHPVWRMNANDVTTEWQYDILGRPVAIYEQQGTALKTCRNRLVYGENEPNAQTNNLNGMLVRHYDTAGLDKTTSFTMHGAPLTQSRQLLADMEQPSDWQTDSESVWESLLDTNMYIASKKYDALGQIISLTDAKGNEQETAYNCAGQLKSATLSLKGQPDKTILSKIEYNASGQKQSELAGNGITTNYIYEETTLRLTDIIAAAGSSVLQSLHYEYDPVGNVTLMQNNAEQTTYFRNQAVAPQRQYMYDALYQLISSSGRESDVNRTYQSFPPVISPIPVDASQYVNYTENYYYDRGGNFYQLKHIGANNYTTNITVSDRTNRAIWLQDQTISQSDVDEYFDSAGNQQVLLPGMSLKWTTRDQLKSMDRVIRETGENDRESYGYCNGGTRIYKSSVHQTSGGTNSSIVIYLPGLEIRTKKTNGIVTELLQVVMLDNCTVTHWESGLPSGMTNDEYRYNLTDLLGARTLVYDSSALLISKEEYYPYGGTAIWAARSEIEANYKFVRYSGKERDSSGLYYYGFRYYIPWAGRWLNPDPIGVLDGLNVYCMVRNNPISISDPDGLAGNRPQRRPRTNFRRTITRRHASTSARPYESVAGPSQSVAGTSGQVLRRSARIAHSQPVIGPSSQDVLRPYLTIFRKRPTPFFSGKAAYPYLAKRRDGDYMYHATTLFGFANIIKTGLQANRGGTGGATAIIASDVNPSEATKYVANSQGFVHAAEIPEISDRYAHEYDVKADKGELLRSPVMLRFHSNDTPFMPDPDERPGAVKTQHDIAPERLEMLSQEGWVSLNSEAVRMTIQTNIDEIRGSA